MAVIKNLMVRAGADFSAITKQAKKASSSMQSMQNSVTKACNGMSQAAAGLKKAFAAVGIGLSAAAIVNFGKEAAAAYDAQAESEIKLAAVMRNTMGATNDQIQSILDLTSAQQRLGVIGDEVQLAGAQELATYLSLTDSLQSLIPVMNDMAAQQFGYNATAEQTTTIATMLGKVMNGQVGALSRYGYTFDEAQEKILKYGTEAQRAAVLCEVVEQSVGGMNAALAATPTGRMKQLSNVMGDIKEQFGQAIRTIGTVFLPVLNAVAKTLAAIATLANKVAQSIANAFGGKAAGKDWQFLPTGASVAVGDMSDAVDELSDSEKKSTKSAKEAKKAQEQLQNMSFDTLEILADHSSSSYGSEDEDDEITIPDFDTSTMIKGMDAVTEAGEGLSGLEKVLGKIGEAWEKFKSKLDLSKISEAFGRLKKSFGKLGESLGKVGSWLWEHILEPLAVWTVNDALPAFIDVLAGVIDVLSAAIDRAWPWIEKLWEKFLKPVAEWVGKRFIDDMERLADQLSKLADVLRGDMSFGEFLGQLNLIETALLAFGGAKLLGSLGTFVSNVSGKFTTLTTTLSGVPGKITAAGESISASLAGAATAIGTAALAVADALMIAYDYKALKEASDTYSEAQEAHNRETETALSNYEKLYETKGKEVADQWAAMVYQIDTTGMSLEESQKAIAEKVDSYWDDVPQNMWDGFKQGWDYYFGEGSQGGLVVLLEDAFNGAVTGIKNLLGIHSPSTVFEDMGEDMVQGLENGFDRKWNSFFAGIKESWSRLKSWWSNLTLPEFRIKLPHVSWSGKFSLNPPSVPKFSISWYGKGGIVDGATLIGAGEAGKEAIVPLERNMEWVTRVADQIRTDLSNGGGVMPVTVAGADSGMLEQLASLLFDAVSSATSQRGEIHIHPSPVNINGRKIAEITYEDRKQVDRNHGSSLINNFA